MKKYKLLKDLPGKKAGAIFKKRDNYYFNASKSHSDSNTILDEVVENNPDWFEEVNGQEIIEGNLEFLYGEIGKRQDGDSTAILIINPTPQTRELLNGKTVERWVSDDAFKELRNGKDAYERDICVEPDSYRKNKILITLND